MDKNELVLGVDIGGTDIKIGIVNASGKIVENKKIKTSVDIKAEDFVAELSKNIKEISSDHKIRSVGIGVPGLVDPFKGKLFTIVNIPSLSNFDLGVKLEQACGIKVFLDNDVNAMALGELYYGAGKNYKNIIALTLGTGIGGAIVINGELYRGTSFTAGEIGHITVNPDGPRCNCGNYGCVESYAGREGMVNRAKAYLSRKNESKISDHLEDGEITPISIEYAAKDGDKLAKKVYSETGRYLGIALGSLVNVFNPEVIIIGGGISKAGDLIFKPIKDEISRRAFTAEVFMPEIIPAKLENNAGIIGAASIAKYMGSE